MPFFCSSRRRHTSWPRDWSSDVCSSDLGVCVDNLEAVAGNHVWEQALFHLYNRLRDQGRCLVVAATEGPHQLPIELAGLRSRLQWGVSQQLRPLDDGGRSGALRQRAQARGLVLSQEVAQYLLQRLPRDTKALL